MDIGGFVVLSLVLLMAPGLLAQENLPITNLGAREVSLDSNSLAYSVEEAFAGEDLNGDGHLGADRHFGRVVPRERSYSASWHHGLRRGSYGR